MKKFKYFVGILIITLSLTSCVATVVGGVATTGLVVAQERSAGDAVDDIVISAHIKHLYLNENANDLLAGTSVEVIEGRVHLTGKVKTAETRVDAVRLAWQPKGVKEVINEIQIEEKASIKTIAKDNWIAAQLNTKIILEKDVRSVNYSTDVVNGIVYIMGISQDREELNKIVNIARKIKGVTEVITHVRMKNDVE